MPVRNVTAESNKPSKEAELPHEDDAAKDTCKATASAKPGVGEKQPTHATDETLLKEQEADQEVPKETEWGSAKLNVQEIPPQEPEKTREIKANEETAAPKLSEVVARPEHKENGSESAEEPSQESPGDSKVSCAPEPATQEDSPVAVEPQGSVPEATKYKAVASEEGIVKADEATAVKEEAQRSELVEKIKAEEESERLRDEKLKQEQARKEHKQRETERRERAEAEGLLFTKAQKMVRARMEATLKEQGIEVSQIGEKKTSRITDRCNRNQRKKPRKRKKKPQ